jgi:LmbE family N-acetylglucosaminyl deacetylase
MAQRTLLAVGAHADDIELNVGGTLLKYRDRGWEVVYVMATNNMAGGWSEVQDDGSIAVSHPSPGPMMQRRKAEAAAGAEALGCVPIHLDHPQRHYNGPAGDTVEVRYGGVLPDGVPPDVPTILTAHEHQSALQPLVDLILTHQPVWVLTHGMAQVDMEHLGTALLVTKSVQQARAAGYRGGLLQWREGITCLGPRNESWDTFVDISDHLERKIALIALHECQMPRPHRPDFPPLMRALEWGRACGVGAAEVFTIVAESEADPLQ